MQGERSSYNYNNDGRIEDVEKARYMANAADEYYNKISDIEKAKRNLGNKGLKAAFSNTFRSRRERESITNGEKEILREAGYNEEDMSPREIHDKIGQIEKHVGVDDYANSAIGKAMRAIEPATAKADEEYDRKVLGIGRNYVRDPIRAEYMAYAEGSVRENIDRLKETLKEYLSLPETEQFKIALNEAGSEEDKRKFEFSVSPYREGRSEIIAKYIHHIEDIAKEYIDYANYVADVAVSTYDAGQEALKRLEDQKNRL